MRLISFLVAGFACAQEFIPESIQSSTSLFDRGSVASRCYVSCINEAVALSSCDADNAACTCADKSLIQRTSNCVLVNCDLSELLVWQKQRAGKCNLPIRDQSTAILAAEWFLFSLSILAVGLRVFARRHFSTGLGWDDFLIFISLGPLTATTICQTIAVRTGLGRDIWAIEFKELEVFLMCRFLVDILFYFQIFSTKASILCLYLRIFPAPLNAKFRTYCFILLGLGLCITIISFFTLFFACHPIDLSWRSLWPHVKDKCIYFPALPYLGLAVDVFADFLVFLSPIQNLELNLMSSHKAVTILLFLLGLLITAAGSVRLAWVPNFVGTANVTHDIVPWDLVSYTEESLGVVFACVPTYARMFRAIRTFEYPESPMRENFKVKVVDQDSSSPFGTFRPLNLKIPCRRRTSRNVESGLELGDALRSVSASTDAIPTTRVMAADLPRIMVTDGGCYQRP